MIVIHAFANNLHWRAPHSRLILLAFALLGETAVPPHDHVPATRLYNPAELAQPAGYSHVAEIRAGVRLIFIAGQVALAADGTLVGRDDAAAQADQVFRNLSAALSASGASLRDVVKFTVYVRDMKHLSSYRAARDRHLPKDAPPPASTLVEVSRLFRDEFLIEVDAVAAVVS